MIEQLCEIVDVSYYYKFDTALEEIKKLLDEGFFPLVLVNGSMLYKLPRTEHGHYIIIKDITEENIIINDPDQEYGGEDKITYIGDFIRAWKYFQDFMLVIKGETR